MSSHFSSVISVLVVNVLVAPAAYAQTPDLGVPKQNCANGDAVACNSVGVRLGHEGNALESATFLQKACSLQLPLGCSNLAELAYDGRGIKRDVERALHLFGSACNAGEPQGCGGVCVTLFEAIPTFTVKQRRECSRIVELNCKVGNPWMCQHKALTPWPLTPGKEQSLREACRKETPDACMTLGVALASIGRFGESVTSTRRACNLGHHEGCSNLGKLYFTGDGVKKDLSKAGSFFRAACEEGVDDGCVGACLVAQATGDAADAELDADNPDCDEQAATACSRGNFWVCEQLAAMKAGDPYAEPSPSATPACTPKDAATAQELVQEYVRLAISARPEELGPLIQRLSQIPPSCFPEQKRTSGPGAQFDRQNRELQARDQLRQEMSDLNQAQMWGKAASLGIFK